MPKGPKGQKRPGDVVGTAVKTMKVLTGDIDQALNEKRASIRGRTDAHKVCAIRGKVGAAFR
jgi:hypothetical protein